MKKLLVIVVGVLTLAGFFMMGYGYATKMADSKHANDSRFIGSREGQTKYPLLAKRLFVDNPNDAIIDLAGIRKQVNSYIETSIGKESASFYFEYLPTGVSFDPGHDNTFVAASLLKLPQVMDLYKAAELGRVDLDQKIALKSDWLDSDYGNLYQKGAGYKLTLREAARLAIIDSDNTAIEMIQQTLISGNSLQPDEQAMNFIDTDYALTAENKVLIGSGTYSSILKCLYFSCYLAPDSSQQILQYMSESIATNRLRAGVPTDVKLAHKIGTFSQEVQSDCGIVYVPNRNYVLCVMVKKSDAEGTKHIANLSKMVYSYIAGL